MVNDGCRFAAGHVRERGDIASGLRVSPSGRGTGKDLRWGGEAPETDSSVSEKLSEEVGNEENGTNVVHLGTWSGAESS